MAVVEEVMARFVDGEREKAEAKDEMARNMVSFNGMRMTFQPDRCVTHSFQSVNV